jgi:hypothetical protein
MGMMAAGVGLGALQGYEQYKQASAQYKADKAAQQVNNQEAQTALSVSYRALEEESDQINENYISTLVDQQKAAAIAIGTAKANAGASGTGGTGSGMVQSSYDMEENREGSKASINRTRQLNEVESDKAASYTTFNGRVNLMDIQKPDALSYILGSAVSGFQMGSSLSSAASSWKSSQSASTSAPISTATLSTR